ncbi:MAG: response regulator [Calditrichia bacterium]
MENILFVDDDRNLLEGLKRNLRRNFNLETALGGEEGLEILQKKGPFAVIVSDMRMPKMDGTQFLAQARRISPDSVRILLTGQADINDAIAVINKGHIFRFLTKPCPYDVLVNALNDGIAQYRLITSEKELLEKTLKGSIKLLVDIISIISPEAFSRSVKLHRITKRIANRLNITDPWKIDIAAMLSQIGCVTIPGDILKKKYEGKPLTREENEMYLKHTRIGSELLRNIPRLEEIAEAIDCQERKFKDENSAGKKPVPFISRILKVALDYDALISFGKSPEEALEVMKNNDGWYDPEVLGALESEVFQAEKGFIIKEIFAKNIEKGMILADDVKTKYGALLIPKGHEISSILKIRILNFAKNNNIMEPLKILESVQKAV